MYPRKDRQNSYLISSAINDILVQWQTAHLSPFHDVSNDAYMDFARGSKFKLFKGQ